MHTISKDNSFALKPFLRWPGGKRWLLPVLKEIIGNYTPKTYFEPFLGGGALFFGLPQMNAILSDVNQDLILTYNYIKQRPKVILNALKKLEIKKEIYDNFRTNNKGSKLYRAVRFLYLNRTSFNGLYRVNKAGLYNVPFANGSRTTSLLCETTILEESSKHLKFAELLVADFSEVIPLAQKGDLLFCDPTYTVKHNNNGFRRYNEELFSWADQERLAILCEQASHKGVKVIVSNAYHKDIKDIFNSFKTCVVTRNSCLSASALHRIETQEYLFHNFK